MVAPRAACVLGRLPPRESRRQRHPLPQERDTEVALRFGVLSMSGAERSALKPRHVMREQHDVDRRSPSAGTPRLPPSRAGSTRDPRTLGLVEGEVEQDALVEPFDPALFPCADSAR
jgi:hypothetical protein